MPRILPELYNLGFPSIIQARKGTYGRAKQNAVRVFSNLNPMEGTGVTGPYPAPTGYKWVAVVSNGQQVVSNGITVVTLQRKT